MALIDIDLGVASEGSLNTDLQAQLNTFIVTEIRNKVTSDPITTLEVQRHLREIEPRERVPYMFFERDEDSVLHPRGSVVFTLPTGAYIVKPDRNNPLKDTTATFEFR